MLSSVSISTAALVLFSLVLSPAPVAAASHRSPLSSRMRRVVRAGAASKRGEAVLQCNGLYAFSLCYPGFVDCSVSQSVALGTICLDGAIAAATSAPQSSEVSNFTTDASLPSNTDLGNVILPNRLLVSIRRLFRPMLPLRRLPTRPIPPLRQ